MIDFSSLTLEMADGKSAFVGLLLRNGTPTLRMPLGFESILDTINGLPAEERYERVKSVYFILYSALRAFARTGSSMKGSVLQDFLARQNKQHGRSEFNAIKQKGDAPSVMFSALDRLWGVLNLQEEPYLLQLVERAGRKDAVDWGGFHRNLHRANFLEDGTAIVDQDFLTRRTLPGECPSDLVRMCCFIAYEISNQMGWECTEVVSALSQEYRSDHLSSDASLFKIEQWRETRETLCDHLERIDAHSIRDDVYLDFYEAADHFLNGVSVADTKEAWGIAGFSCVWEAACIEGLIREGRRVALADTANLTRARAMQIASHRRHEELEQMFSPMRPDAVWLEGDGGLMDAKYRLYEDAKTDPKLYTKQYIYSWILRRIAVGSEPENELWFPAGEDATEEVQENIMFESMLGYLKGLSGSNEHSKKLYNLCKSLMEAELGASPILSGVKFRIRQRNALDLLAAYAEGFSPFNPD
ncbi:hypothetical protein [Magnetospirillum aberrantis]|uniref:Uncharacterized protein n=1 Tax=Magnetospirillum aberrantis SpK TaxID=908842 RepID=A0A7C9QSZ3_9PROT|nr:hypothetical protein [Magnetospirillum aberrantis]NFV79883.1 hypothetical protein [Magnetospirillum aberrantis SpK]